jgi:importin-5
MDPSHTPNFPPSSGPFHLTYRPPSPLPTAAFHPTLLSLVCDPLPTLYLRNHATTCTHYRSRYTCSLYHGSLPPPPVPVARPRSNPSSSSAERAVDERLLTHPDLYILALAQFSISANTEVMRSFSLVLVRRLLFRQTPGYLVERMRVMGGQGGDATGGGQQQQQGGPQQEQAQGQGQTQGGSSSPQPPSQSFHRPPTSSTTSHSPGAKLTLYDALSPQTLTTLERLLLHSLLHETSTSVRAKAIDTICDVSNQGMGRGRPWHALQAGAFELANAGMGKCRSATFFVSSFSLVINKFIFFHPDSYLGQNNLSPTDRITSIAHREAAYKLFAGSPYLVMDLQLDAVLGVFQRGLQDAESVDVRLAALEAGVRWLQSCGTWPGPVGSAPVGRCCSFRFRFLFFF